MIKTFIKGNILIIFAIFFAVPLFFLFGDLFNHNYYNYKDILKNGIETEAYIISGTETTSSSVNDVPYYTIKYRYFDEKMIEHFGWTSESYTYSQIETLIDNETLKIKYIPGTFESIESNYDPSKDQGKNVNLIFLILFPLIDLGLWIAVIIKGRNNLIIRKVELEGVEYTGYVTSISTNTEVDGVSKYKVHYNYKNELGETFSRSTGSIYFYDEAKALESIKQVTVKAIGKHSIISTQPDVSILYEENIKQENNTPTEQHIICEYCGNNVLSSDQYCSNCGAIINHDNK